MINPFFIKTRFPVPVKIICAGLFTLLYLTSFSQVFYSTKPDYLKVKSESNNLLSAYELFYPDTTISALHDYFPRNFTGNPGLPSPAYILNYRSENPGFNLYPSPQENDRFTEKQVEYYRTRGPFANVTGIAGSRQLQILKLFFTHTYKEKFNLSLRLNRYSSQGFYLNQQSFTNNFFVSSNYAQKNKRSGYYFFFLNNSNRYRENGGIQTDTLNDSLMLTSPKTLLPVKLSSARRDNREYNMTFNPWLKLNRSNDSARKINNYIQLKSGVFFGTYLYNDPNPLNDGFFTLFYNDTAQTYDSTRVFRFRNEVSYSISNTEKTFQVSAGYRNEINRVWQFTDSMFGNDIVFTDVAFNKTFAKNDSSENSGALMENNFNAQYIINGSNSGDYKAENRISFSLTGKLKPVFFLNLSAESRHPDYIYNHWQSNHFTWTNNGYKPSEFQQARLGFSLGKKAGASVLFQNVFNYLYFDHIALPRQYAGNIQNTGVSAFYSQVFFRHLGFYLQHTIQNTSHPDYVRIPQNISTARLFFSAILFKNNLHLNIGVQGQVYQSFNSYGYMPATQVFYLQTTRNTGEYPYVDVYLNARIRPVSVFFKVENALQGYAGANYSLVHRYYQPDRAFRFGINWMFFD